MGDFISLLAISRPGTKAGHIGQANCSESIEFPGDWQSAIVLLFGVPLPVCAEAKHGSNGSKHVRCPFAFPEAYNTSAALRFQGQMR